MFKTTNQLRKYWEGRKIDWNEAYFKTANHPHRYLIMEILKSFKWGSLWEVGCGGGANLARICQVFPGKQLGGSDINKDAIEFVKDNFKGAIFEFSSGDNILLSDKSCDVILTDMTLIYVGPLKIKDYLNEFKRIARSRVILVELHSNNFFERLKLRYRGYHCYNYLKLLEKLGFYDVMMWKIGDLWKGHPQEKYGYVISAKI